MGLWGQLAIYKGLGILGASLVYNVVFLFSPLLSLCPLEHSQVAGTPSEQPGPLQLFLGPRLKGQSHRARPGQA
jgi:hypothetical protein